MTDCDKLIDPIDEKRLLTRVKGVGKDYLPFILLQDLSSSEESVRILGHVTGRIADSSA
jgi:hypothetical protein